MSTEKITNLAQLDLNGIYSYKDYLSWQFDQAVELIKGKIFPMAAPTPWHQIISWRIASKIDKIFEANNCLPFSAPLDVRLFDKKKSLKANKEIYTVVQPDLCIICDREKIDKKGCLGAPDLIIEILSPGNSSKEMKLKKNLYEENKVREYWIVDPDHETVILYNLQKGNGYSIPKIFVSEDVVTSHIFSDLSVDLTKLFEQM